VRECYAAQGPTLKRIRAAPMGRAFRIIKRTSHLTVFVGQRPEKVAVVARVGGIDDEVVESKQAVEPGGRKQVTAKKAAPRGAAGVKKTTKKKIAKKASKKSND